MQPHPAGSCDAFRRLVRVRGKDVLYIGDHIFGDVLRSKKTRGWRTFLVVPELSRELSVWTGRSSLFQRLGELEAALANVYRDLDNKTKEKPEISQLCTSIKAGFARLRPTFQEVSSEMDQEYGIIGSLFRSGSRTTFFASQVQRYADLYASSCYNLVHYPMFYFFRAPMSLMSHERTVDHHANMAEDQREPESDSVGQRGEGGVLGRPASVRGWNRMMSKAGTFCYDEEEEEADKSSNSENDPDSSQREGKKFSHAELCEAYNDRDVVVPNPSHVDEEC